MGLRIAGADKFNAEQEKREHATLEERRHRELLTVQSDNNKIAREANDIARTANDIAKKANSKSKIANIISIISAFVAIGSLIATIVLQCR